MRNEYPRPELVRSNWLNLNGEWDFEFDFGNSGITIWDFYIESNKLFRFEEMQKKQFSKKINVPFCPESKLSGIEYKDFINGCWYKKEVEIPDGWKGRVLLHFEAAYYETYVVVNGKVLGSHKGGYTPFTFDITDCIEKGKAQILVHCSGDPRDRLQPSGKQSITYESHGCFYTRSTGIWQTVWIENVPDTYLTAIKTDSDTDNKKLNAKLTFNALGDKKVTLKASFGGKPMGEVTAVTTMKEVYVQLPVRSLKLWDVKTPNLYDLTITVESESGKDEITSYFGMRKIELDETCLKLNGKKIMQRLVLDQGYYPDGIYTAPTDEDLKKDILISQRLGFNGARLHQKVFERRFLYYCDKLGYIVWGEYPSWNFDHTTDRALQYYLPEWLESVERDYNHPAIIGWCPTNENWKINKSDQCDAFIRQLYLETKRYDTYRPVIDVSWNYHVQTDIFDTHDYVQDTAEFRKRYGKWEDGKCFEQFNQKYDGQPYFLSEYGGIKWSLKDDGWGYGDGPKTVEEFVKRYNSFTKTLLSNPRMCALCYTQLYDVEQEQNGLYNYDRTPKFSEEIMDDFKKNMTKKAAIEKE